LKTNKSEKQQQQQQQLQKNASSQEISKTNHKKHNAPKWYKWMNLNVVLSTVQYNTVVLSRLNNQREKKKK